MEDEEVAESWEEAADSGEIDRRLEKKLKITQKERKSKSPPKVPIVIQDDSLPTGPPPQIRILKRPTSNGVVSSPNSTSRPALPVKSLAQREAEYAEARKRILGSASPEEEQEKPILDRSLPWPDLWGVCAMEFCGRYAIHGHCLCTGWALEHFLCLRVNDGEPACGEECCTH
ncbi:SUZ RNA-binding domain-containing isoform 3-T3 [Megaptera novaeangliae]